MSWILVSEYIECIFEFRLLYLAMSGQVPRCRAMINKTVLREKALRVSVISGREVDLSKEEGIIRVI